MLATASVADTRILLDAQALSIGTKATTQRIGKGKRIGPDTEFRGAAKGALDLERGDSVLGKGARVIRVFVREASNPCMC
jgi:hypothetical protein